VGRKDDRVTLPAFSAPALLRNLLQRLKPAAMIGQMIRMHALGVAASPAEHPQPLLCLQGIDEIFYL